MSSNEKRSAHDDTPPASAARLRSIVFDCHHPASLARFWATMLGYTVRPYDSSEIERLHAAGLTAETDPTVVIDPVGSGPKFWFNRVTERKFTKNRVHLDVNLERVEDVERIVDLGATIVRSANALPGEHWYVMVDPEGNEFCAFPPEPPS